MEGENKTGDALLLAQRDIEAAKILNEGTWQRTILLTERELEPYFIYERTNAELGIDLRGNTPEEMAQATTSIYFN